MSIESRIPTLPDGVSPWMMAEAWLTLLRVRVALRLRPKTTLRNALPRRARSARTPRAIDPQVVGAAVRAFARSHVVPMTCLVRAIAIKRMLERRDLTPDLCIGFMKEGDRLHGHAWVEVEGTVVADSPQISERFGLKPSGEAWLDADSYDGYVWWFDAE